MFWPLVLLLLILPKDNRNRKAWLILIPLLGIHLLCFVILKGLSIPDENAEVFYSYISAIAIALACLWLFAHRLATRRLLCFFSSLAFVTCLSLIMVYPIADPDTIEQDLSLFAFCGGIALILCLGIVIAVFCCRRSFKARRFVPWLFLSYLVLSILFMCVYFLYAAIQFDVRIEDMITAALIASCVLCVFLFVITLPYLILSFTNPLYRQRFRRLLHLPPQSPE